MKQPCGYIEMPFVAPEEAGVPELKPEQIIAPLSLFDEITEEEILYWSTPYYDELQAMKEEQKRKAEELG